MSRKTRISLVSLVLLLLYIYIYYIIPIIPIIPPLLGYMLRARASARARAHAGDIVKNPRTRFVLEWNGLIMIIPISLN